ncbi:MAG TPA: hypothetical protein VLR90_22745, partial [Blastocatellia bacterium]|nr:hypothetical protein [Blastocatellia bacterium]
IRFQQSGDLLSVSYLTAEEARRGESVFDSMRATEDKHYGLLYVGNSQSLAVMDRHSDDIITPQWLQILFARQHDPTAQQLDVRLGSLPNITMTEVLIKLIVACEQSPRHTNAMIAAVVLEEFRGLGVRQEVASELSAPAAKNGLIALVENNSDLPAARKALEPLLKSESQTVAAYKETRSDSVANRLENRLQVAAERVPIFARRQNLQTAINLTFNFWRNRLLGITSSMTRPVPPSVYQADIELIELALRYARSKEMPVIFYLAPMRLSVQPNPNLPSDVARFRQDVPALCRRYDVTCLDYVDLIPENLWANYPEGEADAGQRDFAHFTGAAHKKLAEQLASDIGPQLIREKSE